MAFQINVISHIEEVLASLKTANGRILANVGMTVEAAAIKNSPVRTGALKSSWTFEVDEGEQSVTIGVPDGALEGNYAKYVEAGTSRGQRPQHMLRNAVDSNMSRFPQIAEVEYKNA